MTSNPKEIIQPVERALIEAELNEDRFVRNTNKAGNKIYIVNHHNSPNTMQEIGDMSIEILGQTQIKTRQRWLAKSQMTLVPGK